MPFDHRAIVTRISELLLERYIDPAVAHRMASCLTENTAAYCGIADGAAFAERLTSDLYAVSQDRHVNARYDPDKAALLLSPGSDQGNLWAADAWTENYGFTRVEWLRRAIGYVELRMFAPPELGGDIAVAAMNFLANAKAIIFDLRENSGGSPNMVQLLTTYLFDGEPRHLTTFYTRYNDEYQQFWTLPHVPGRRLSKALVYVLTSKSTFSAAEEFANNLKVMKRATLVGERTAGGAHPGERHAIDSNFTLFVPDGRGFNAITKSNWEGAGVEPHVEKPAEESLNVAQQLALEALIQTTGDEKERQRLQVELRKVLSDSEPPPR